MNELDLPKLLEGMSDEQVRAFRDKLAVAVHGIYAEVNPQQPQPDGRTVEAIEEELQEVSGRLKAMQKNPSAFRGKIENLRTRSDELWKEREQALTTKASLAQAARAPEIARLEAETERLAIEHKGLSGAPSANRARLKELNAQIVANMNQIQNLRRG